MAKKDLVKTQLRLPPGLHAQLVQAIAESGRSMNAEIVARLERSFPPAPDSAAFADRLRMYDELSVRTRYAQMKASEAEARLAYAEPGTVEHDEATKALLLYRRRHDDFAAHLASVQREIESLIEGLNPAP